MPDKVSLAAYLRKNKGESTQKITELKNYYKFFTVLSNKI